MNNLNINKSSKYILSIFAAFTLFTANVVSADELDSTLSKVKELVAQKNYSAALEELGWARKEIEKMNSGQIGTFFPDELAGYSGKKLESTSVMGFTNIERDYVKGSSTVKVSLTGSAGGGDNGLGGLAALGQMAAMFGGNAPGQETLRIQGRTAIIDTQSSNANLTIFLASGSILKFETLSAGTETSTLRAMASAMKLDDLEKYIKGGK